MSDLISRQAAIDALMNNEPSAWYNDDYERGEIARFHEDVTTIKNVPSVRRKRKPPAQPEPRWIAVEERLPEERGEYLVTVKNLMAEIKSELIDIALWNDKIEDNRGFLKADEVTAWMPLPKPYERREDG